MRIRARHARSPDSLDEQELGSGMFRSCHCSCSSERKYLICLDSGNTSNRKNECPAPIQVDQVIPRIQSAEHIALRCGVCSTATSIEPTCLHSARM